MANKKFLLAMLAMALVSGIVGCDKAKQAVETVKAAAAAVEQLRGAVGGGANDAETDAGSSGAGSSAQDSFFPAKAGTVLTYANNDAKGNTESYSVLTIKDVTGSGRNMIITYVGTALDKNRNPVRGVEMTYQAVIKDGVVVMDINQIIPAEMKVQGVKIDASGTPMEVPGPGDLKAGQSLKPSEITLTMDLGIMKTNSVMKIEGKCLAIEDVKVPAGTFKCHKLSRKITTTTMGMSVIQTVVEWYAPGIGQVKTETYDDKNTLVSGSVLVELKGR